MTAALIGVFGVIVGGLLAALFQRHQADANRRTDGKAGARVLVQELDMIVGRIETGVEKEAWWPDPLPVVAWETEARRILDEISAETRLRLHDVYRKVDSFNRDQPAGLSHGEGELPVLGDGLRAELRGFLRDTRAARQALNNEALLDELAPRWYGMRRSIVLVVLLGMLALLLGLGLTPRVDVNDRTVTMAVQAGMGEMAFVDCDPEAGDWRCVVSTVPGGDDCLALLSAAVVSARRCETAASPRVLEVVSRPGGLTAAEFRKGERATASGSAAPLETVLEPAAVRTFETPRTRPLTKVWRWFTGNWP